MGSLGQRRSSGFSTFITENLNLFLVLILIGLPLISYLRTGDDILINVYITFEFFGAKGGINGFSETGEPRLSESEFSNLGVHPITLLLLCDTIFI